MTAGGKVRAVLRELNSRSDRTRLAGMGRYGINTSKALGVAVPDLRALAKAIGRNHELATGLWETEVHEARILAGMIDDPAAVTEAQMDAWAQDFDSWDVCDQVCANLFERTRFAFRKAVEWSAVEEEFVKRAGFVLMARSAVRNKDAADREFEVFLPIIRAESIDERNQVKKAVSWALRQIGKRSPDLNAKAIATAKQLRTTDSRSSRWVASDALRELTSEAVQKRLANL